MRAVTPIRAKMAILQPKFRLSTVFPFRNLSSKRHMTMFKGGEKVGGAVPVVVEAAPLGHRAVSAAPRRCGSSHIVLPFYSVGGLRVGLARYRLTVRHRPTLPGRLAGVHEV